MTLTELLSVDYDIRTVLTVELKYNFFSFATSYFIRDVKVQQMETKTMSLRNIILTIYI